MPSRTVLLVEDDPFNRDILHEILEEFPEYTIEEAANGVEALLWLQAHPDPALMLLDMMMPEMDGYTLLERLREAGRHSLRVVGISARARTGDMEKALAAGCWRYLTKPFNISEVEAVVKEGLELDTN